MKNHTLILLFLVSLSLISWKHLTKEKIFYVLESIESIVQKKDFESLEIKIKNVNHYGGVFELNSTIEKLNKNQISIKTFWKSKNESEKDTIMILETTDFIERLNYEKKMIQYAGEVPGNYQYVALKTERETLNYNTTKSFGLISQLQRGKSNIRMKE